MKIKAKWRQKEGCVCDGETAFAETGRSFFQFHRVDKSLMAFLPNILS